MSDTRPKQSSKSNRLKDFLQWIWVPFLWAGLVFLHMVVFHSGEVVQSKVVYLFDRLILFSCFLLYPIRFFWGGSYFIMALAFAVQFFFWWMMVYGAVIVYRKMSNN